MANRKQRAAIARETVEILESGSYRVGSRNVSIRDALARSKAGSRLYTPAMVDDLIEQHRGVDSSETLSVEVRNETTFAAARRLSDRGSTDVLCLNFASAKSPGGGFLSGSQAQEEALARASGLYTTLKQHMEYYDFNRALGTSLYSDHAIYSPHVPVFRADDDSLLDVPYEVAMVTSPAVNAGAVLKNEPDRAAEIEPTMRHRIRSVLAIAARHQHRRIVLGAWGCGVFRNDPSDVALWFSEELKVFSRCFEHVAFAVLDFAAETPTFGAFHEQFGGPVNP
ncbi:MAG: TIGR02452 family protein [Myxococcota bacterium]